jgi:5-methylcytosine-specific restriction endonuclease McrA
VVPRCGVPYGLEIDHVHPLEEGGLTELSNLALLCHHHHRMKTYGGATLERTGIGDDGSPTWAFTPMPPFGQEPDPDG